MRVALAQINPTLGDFDSNREKILDHIKKAKEKFCDLVVFPEASLFGYHPVDLLERTSIVKAQCKSIRWIHTKIPKDISVLVGAITENDKKGKPFFNAAVLLEKGKKPKVFAKELLPNYDVFDEGRHIEPGQMAKNIFRKKGQKVLVTICEDIWAWPLANHYTNSKYDSNPMKRLKSKDVDLIVNLSASPFTDQKFKKRMNVCRQSVKHLKAPMIYVNMVGAQDELIFDGGSFAMDKNGKTIAQSVRFSEDLNVLDLDKMEGGQRVLAQDVNELRRQAIALGIRDFVEKIGMNKVHLGLSGGIDSALVACLAVDALGPSNVTCIAMPGPFSSEDSAKLAQKLTENLGCEFMSIPINDAYDDLNLKFQQATNSDGFGLVQENFQARLRGIQLMAFSNLKNSLLLNTSNKSELAVGYSTLYGDLCGGLSPIGDLLKTEVYELSRYYNKEYELIPEEIIERDPSAELRPDQKDSDSLPQYDVLDPIVEKLVENYRSPKTEQEWDILKKCMISEFKRWQAPPILKVSDHAFGRGRRFPIAHRAIY